MISFKAPVVIPLNLQYTQRAFKPLDSIREFLSFSGADFMKALRAALFVDDL